jgi:hypothetical protein
MVAASALKRFYNSIKNVQAENRLPFPSVVELFKLALRRSDHNLAAAPTIPPMFFILERGGDGQKAKFIIS